eukprot:gene10413-12786_t
MKVVLLAGGLGTRLSEETVLRPKPMVEIGGMPILWHIMKIYAASGYTDFSVALGYKGDVIKEFFMNYKLHKSDMVVNLKTGKLDYQNDLSEDWTVGLHDTGLSTLTGGRLLRLKKLFKPGDTFMLTYGDGVANIDIKELVKFHQNHGKLATLTAVRPPARFGSIVMDDNGLISEFKEKPQIGEGWINGGFFVFNYEIFSYLENDETILEREPLENLCKDGQLVAYQHGDFWQCMDTIRDRDYLNVLVTGHTGFKGSWLTAWLLSLGAEVAGYSLSVPTEPSHIEELGVLSKIKHYLGDIRNYSEFYQVCREFEPEFIFHLAAQPLVRDSYTDPLNTFEVNMIGTLNVLEVIRNMANKVKVGIIITSDKCYDNVEWVHGYRENDALGGADPYSGSKGAAELIAKSYMLSFFKGGKPRVATVRAGNVIGGGDWAKDRIVPDIVKSWSTGKPVEIRSPYSTRPWQHVLEPLSGYLDLAAHLYQEESELYNQAFNFGPDSKINKNVGELIDEMKLNWTDSPGWINQSVSGSDMKESNLLKLSCDKANILLKWYPVMGFEETISFTVKWYVDFYQNEKEMFIVTTDQINEYTQKAKEQIADERGAVFHYLRADDPAFKGFGEAYYSKVNPGIVKGWKYHREISQEFCVPFGRIDLVVYDGREDSTTFGQIDKITLDDDANYFRLSLPPGLWYSFKATSKTYALLANIIDKPHSPGEETLESIINQTYKNWEVIFWDNQSTDRSAEYLKSYNEPRFKYYYAPDFTPLSTARNLAIEKTTGELIAFVDCDDLWSRDKLELQISYFEDGNVGVVYSDFELILESDSPSAMQMFNSFSRIVCRPHPCEKIYKRLLRSNFIIFSTIVIRKSLFKKIGGFTNEFKHNEDYEILLKISLESEAVCIKERTVKYRIHGGNNSYQNEKVSYEENALILNALPVSVDVRKARNMNNARYYISRIMHGERSLMFQLLFSRDLILGLFGLAERKLQTLMSGKVQR